MRLVIGFRVANWHQRVIAGHGLKSCFFQDLNVPTFLGRYQEDGIRQSEACSCGYNRVSGKIGGDFCPGQVESLADHLQPSGPNDAPSISARAIMTLVLRSSLSSRLLLMVFEFQDQDRCRTHGQIWPWKLEQTNSISLSFLLYIHLRTFLGRQDDAPRDRTNFPCIWERIPSGMWGRRGAVLEFGELLQRPTPGSICG